MAMTKPHYQADPNGLQKERVSMFLFDSSFRLASFIARREITTLSNHEDLILYGAMMNATGKNLKRKTDGEEPLELIQVCWLQVTGSVGQLQPGKTYVVTFDVALTADAFGWKDIQVFLMAKVGKKGKYKWAKLKLNQDESNKKVTIPDNNQKLSIDVPLGSTDNTLHFGLYEVWSGKWKGGLKIFNARVTATTTIAA